ncbi:MAG: 16S rRNA (cytidine(1402)-2'-O)-methyltransferase [Bacteroidales bacterium]|nr:16S rRNA (cytidine(1402)-2'-O)-methyltransferase [Bacteroidales bacterium]
MPGILYIVPTPIGNLADITIRSINTLKTVDYILCEDTRQSLILLKEYNITKPLKSYHKFNEHKICSTIINDLKKGNNIALISDAGTPGISDAAFLLIKQCIENNIKIESLPGPTSIIPALLLSGFPTEPFIFFGFLPPKKRKKIINSLKELSYTSIIFESPHKLIKTLSELQQVLKPERKICICKELTKVHECVIRSTIKNITDEINKIKIKGEFVIVIAPNDF